MDKLLTLILPYYNQPKMLWRQVEEIEKYPDSVRCIVVDDGSMDVPLDDQATPPPAFLDVYRIIEDILWNRGMARNLGAYVCETEWLIQTDIDHILPVESVENLLKYMEKLDPMRWYRFPRWRVGAADDTRKKDEIHHRKKFGQIKPHIDSYLMRRDMFFTSPYDERYAGCLGGGSPFLSRMTQIHDEPLLLPENICLHVHTKNSVPDASVTDLSRDREEYKRRRAQFADSAPKKILFGGRPEGQEPGWIKIS